MAVHILDGCKLYIQEFDLSADWNSGTLVLSRSAPDATKFGSGGKEFCPDGIKGHAFSYTGFFDNTTTFSPDDTIFNNLYGINDTGYLLYDAQSANFTVGSKLNGGTSLATATILADTDWGTSGALLLANISGTFQNNETITDIESTPGSATTNGTLGETYLAYDNEANGPFTAGLIITGVTSGVSGTLVGLQDDGATGKMLISGASAAYTDNEEISDGTTTTADVNGASECYWCADLLTTVCPTDGTDGEIAYTFYDAVNYTPIDGAAGTVAGFSVSSTGSGRMTRPMILKNCATAITGAGNGTAYNVGTCAPGHTLRAFVHVYEYDGGTLDLAIQSDTVAGMGSAVEQIGFADVTDVTKEAKTAQMGYLFYDGQSANFTVSSTVTGGTSEATAIILDDTDWGTEGCLLLGSISGTFQDNEEITDAEDPAGTADVNGTLGETYLAYDNEAGGPFTVANTITGVTSLTTGTLVALQDDGLTGKLLISGASAAYTADEEVGDGTATADADGASSAECYWRAQWTYNGTACKFIALLYID